MSNPTIGSQDPLARITANTAAGSNEVVFQQSTAVVTNAITSNAVTITTSVNNDTGDVVRVYSTPGAISVSAVDQIINQYTAVNSGVSSIEAGNNISITSTGGNGQGSVTINADISNVGNVAIANNVRLNAQPNITSVGTLTSLSVSGTILGNNVQVSNGVFSGNGSGLSAIQASNIVGAIPTANTVSNASQPNITSLGNLTSLSVGDTDLPNSVVTLTNPTGSNLFPNTGLAFINQAANGQSRTLDFVRTLGTISNSQSVPNTFIAGQQNFRVFNGNTYPITGGLLFNAPLAADANFTGNLNYIPGVFTVFTGNPTGNLISSNISLGKNNLTFNQYGQLVITNGDGSEQTSGLYITGITNNTASSPVLYLQKQRGTSGNISPVEPNDFLGALNINGYNGSNNRAGSRLYAEVTSNGVIANGQPIPADLVLETNGGNIYLEPLFANFLVNPNGNVFIGDGNTLATLVANTVNSNVVLANTITSNGLTLQGITNANTAQALFYNTSTGVVTYDNVGSLQGIQGIAGSTGIQGIAGSTGIQGVAGSTGIQGVVGSTGIQGIAGSTGIQGIAGSTGIQGIAGSTGIQGITGSTGLLNGMPYSFNTQTSNTDPSFGKLSFDTATLASITEMYISSSDNQSNLVTSWITSFDDFGGSSVKGTLLIRSNTRSYVFLYLNITGNVVFNGLYYTVPVDVVTSTSIFTSNESLSILFTPVGLTGIQGIAGSTGIQGITGSTGIQGIQGIQSVQGLQGLQGTTGPSATNILTTTTTTNLTDQENAINTTGKATGLMVFNTTNNLIYVASGSSASSAWYPSDGSSAINPV